MHELHCCCALTPSRRGVSTAIFNPKVIQTFIKLLRELLLPSGIGGTLMVAERELCDIGGPTIPSLRTVAHDNFSKGLSNHHAKAYQIL